MLIRNRAAFAAPRRRSFFRLRARFWTPVLLEILQRNAASDGNAPAVGHETMGDAFAIRNELPAIDLGVCHAGILILLLISSRRFRRQYGPNQAEPDQAKHENYADIH